MLHGIPWFCFSGGGSAATLEGNCSTAGHGNGAANYYQCVMCFDVIYMVTWLHLRTHHLWRTIKQVGLLSEDHLPHPIYT